MIAHIVLVKARDGLSAEEQSEVRDAIDALRGVPGVQNLTWGEDFSGRSKGYTYAAVMHFADRDALKAYSTAEEHIRIVRIFERLTADRLVVDYEIGTSVNSD